MCLDSGSFQKSLKITAVSSASLSRKTKSWHRLTCTIDYRNHKQLWLSQRIFLKDLHCVIQTVIYPQLKQVTYPGIEQHSVCEGIWCSHNFFHIPLYSKHLHLYSDSELMPMISVGEALVAPALPCNSY